MPLLLTWMALLYPSLTSAQRVIDGLSPRGIAGRSADPSVRGACQALVNQSPPHRARSPRSNGRPDPSAEELRACMRLLRHALATPSGDVSGPALTMRERSVLETWHAIEGLAAWVSRGIARGDDPALLAEVDDLQQSADAALRAQGLWGGSYAATVTAGLVAADPGGQAGAAPGTATHGVTTGFLRVDAETRPLDLGLGWTAAIGTGAGYQPVLAMVVPDRGDAEPIAKRGTTIATELRFAKASRVAELAAVAGAGATRIDLAPVTRRAGGATHVYRAAANDIDEWALRFDARFELRWFDRDVWVRRLEMATLDPLLRASVGIRHDERFHRTGDLQPFNDPTGRVFFGFSLRPVRAQGISAGGAFEFEGALRGDHRLPSIYRVSIDTVVDLRRVFRGRPR